MTPDLLFFWSDGLIFFINKENWCNYQAIKYINIEYHKFKKLTKNLKHLLNQEKVLVCDLITTELEWKKPQ